jgi:dienelactone hydrolase
MASLIPVNQNVPPLFAACRSAAPRNRSYVNPLNAAKRRNPSLSMVTRVVRLFAVIVLFVAPVLKSAADSRADFLKLLDRPHVPLAPEVSSPATDDNGVTQIAFSFASDGQQRVPGILLKSASCPTSAVRRPVVIALHGTGGTKESQLPLLTALAKSGFIAIAIDGRYHGARSTAGKGGDDYQAAILRAFRAASATTPGKTEASAVREYPFFFDTAWDVMRLIDYLETRDDVDAARIGLIGFSKGGIETYLAAAADPRIAVAVPCIGVQSFNSAFNDEAAWRSRIETVQTAFDAAAKDSGIVHPDATFVRTFYDRVAPGIYTEFDGPAMLPLIAPRPLLTINGEKDIRTPLAGLAECADAARAAYKAAGAEDKFVQFIQPKTGHAVTPASLQLARAWFTYWLKP